MAAAVDHAAYSRQVTYLEFLYGTAHRRHSSDDFVTRHRRVDGVVPLVTGGV